MDYQPNPITLREVKGITITQEGHSIYANGQLSTLIMLADVASNSKHFMGEFATRNQVALKTAGATALVLTKVDGRDAQIVLTAEQFALGQPERDRYTAWTKGNIAERAAMAAEYDRKYNDGEHGDNPYRGERQPGGAFDRRERHYPEGA